MKHRLLTMVLAVLVLLSAIPAFATETETTAPEREPGYCGESITWTFQEGTLTIQGEGEMDDFPGDAPWCAYSNAIVRVVISDGITYIGANAFRDYDALQLVTFGADVYEIGAEAFYSCDGLTSVQLPGSFKVFGESCFAGCRNLHEISCAGKFPSFRQNCLWDTYAIIYFPAERPWNVELIRQLEEAFHGRIEFMASDGTDPYVPTEEPTTEAPAEAPTEAPTEEPTTVPPTTQSPTEASPSESAAAQPSETQAPEDSNPAAAVPTEPETEESAGGSGWIGLVIIGLVLILVICGRLAFGSRKKGKYSR